MSAMNNEAAPALSICCFGAFSVRSGDTELEFAGYRVAGDIFNYLLLHRGQRLNSEQLTDVFWPDAEYEVAIHRLHLHISALRRQLGKHDLIKTERRAYLFDPDANVVADFVQFDAHVEQAHLAEKQGQFWRMMDHLQQAAALYHGDYLAGRPEAEWAATTRTYYQRRYMAVLDKLCRFELAAQLHESVLRRGAAWERCDPYQERAHYYIMRALVGLGQRNQAVLHYRQYAKLLQDELDITPGRVTTRLYEKVCGVGRLATTTATP